LDFGLGPGAVVAVFATTLSLNVVATTAPTAPRQSVSVSVSKIDCDTDTDFDFVAMSPDAGEYKTGWLSRQFRISDFGDS